jgi:hypothetical protein
MQRRKHEFKGIHCRDCPFWRPPTRCLDRALKSGRCGDWIWYLRGRKQTRRPYVRPKDPHTLAQMEYRGRLSAASSIYSQYLTEEERHACIAAGAKLQSRRRLGQSGPLTGQQYWICKDSKRQRPQSKATKRKNAAQVPLSQGVSQCSSDPHRAASRVPPDQHRRNVRRTPSRIGRHSGTLRVSGRASVTAIKLRDEMRGWQLSEPPFEFGYLLPPHPDPLPRGEGASSSVARVACTPRLIAAWQMVLPLPEGEGRGEGEAVFRQTYA